MSVNANKRSSDGGENSNQIQETENENLECRKVSTFRIIASQFIAVFPIFLIKLRFGMGTGYTIVLLPELSKENAEIDVNLDELTWFSSYCFVGPVTCIAGGFIAQYIGVRQLLMFSFLTYVLSDLLFHWADSVAMILAAQATVGFGASISKLISYSYVAEVLQPKFRSIVMAALNLIVMCGRFFAILLGNYMHWRTQTFVSLVFPAIGFALVHFIPDSPQWLANKNRYEDAEKSLARLRGWTTPAAVKEELYSSLINVSGTTSEGTDTTTESELHSKRRAKLKETLSLYMNRSFYIPLLTVTVMFFINEFNGGYGIITFSGLIFKEIKSPIAHIASIITTALSIVASLMYIFSVRFLGKRILTLTSEILLTVCFVIAVISLYLSDSDQAASNVYPWITSVALMLSSFAYFFGIGKVVYFLNSELFPQKLRYVGSGIGCFVNEILLAIYGKIFLYIVKGITFPGTLIVLIIINVISFIVIYYFLPETEGIPLLQIEENYAAAQNLKNKHSSQNVNVRVHD